MKKLKFKPHLVEKILSLEKTITWRLFDDKNLQEGDILECINSDTGENFAEVKIINVIEKIIKELNDSDLRENDYTDYKQVMEINKKYYGDVVNEDTLVKIIKFKLL